MPRRPRAASLRGAAGAPRERGSPLARLPAQVIVILVLLQMCNLCTLSVQSDRLSSVISSLAGYGRVGSYVGWCKPRGLDCEMNDVQTYQRCEACVVCCAESAQEAGELAQERQAAQAAVEETRGARPQTKVSQRKLNQVKVCPACLEPFSQSSA